MSAVIEQLPATTNQQTGLAPVRELSPSESAFILAQRKAQAYAKSTLVPQAYQNNIPNVLIAMEVAHRIGANDLMVMQNLYIVHGRPSWSASFLIATVNACQRFTPLRFETRGDDPGKDDYRVRAIAQDAKTGVDCVGAWITWAMVKAEGWHSKNGSKWKTMPEQMFMYRAATFWARVYAPEVSMGIHTADEVEDIVGTIQGENVVRTSQTNLRQLEADLGGRVIDVPANPPPDDDMPIGAEEVHAMLVGAETIDELDDAGDLIRDLPDADHEPLTALYDRRRAELAGE